MSEISNSVRPTKKQRELLEYISGFINEHGYSPSYREIMRGCNYTSVATVALHVNSLVARGHLVKRVHSARSLEVIDIDSSQPKHSRDIKVAEEKWLVMLVDSKFKEAEFGAEINQKIIDELYVLVGALKVLGLPEAAMSFMPRLSSIKERKNVSTIHER